MTFLRHIALLGTGLCVASAPALAHAHLKSAVPPVNGTVASAPTELDLTFSEGVTPAFSGAKLTGSDGAVVTTGAAKRGADSDTTLIVPISAPLPPGSYKVDWHALAADGHKTSGSYTFVVKP